MKLWAIAVVLGALAGGCVTSSEVQTVHTMFDDVGANWSPREPEETVVVSFDNGQRLLYSKKWTRLVGWSDSQGTHLLAVNKRKPPLELLDDYLKPITGLRFGKGNWKGMLREDDGITMVWEIPAGKEDGKVAGKIRVEETFRPLTRNLCGTRYVGFSRQMTFIVPPSLRVRTLRINEAHGVGGTLEGHTSYELRHKWPEVIHWTLKGEQGRKKNIMGFVLGTDDRLGRFMGGSRQPFLFIDHAKGNFLIYPERMDIHWLAYLSSYHADGHDGIWPNLEATVGSKTGRFSIGRINYLFAEAGERLAPQRWLDAKATLATEYRQMLGLKQNRIYAQTFHIQPDWLRMDRYKDGKEMADHYGPILEKGKVDSIFIDTWQFIIPKGWTGKRDAWGCCQIDMLKTAKDFGGDEALKYMCDDFGKRGIDVLLWLNPQWVAGRGTSQEDGKEASAMVRLFPDFVVRGPDGSPDDWKGFYALSWAHGYTDYLIERTKHLRDKVGIKGYFLDASASFIHRVDYRADGADLMLPHFWKLIRRWQDMGMALFFEEPTGIVAFGHSIYRKNQEWFYFNDTVGYAQNLSRRTYELLHANGAGFFNHKVDDAMTASNEYFQKFRARHGDLPDRIELVNLRRDVGGERWLYDNTVWIYGRRRVPYRIVDERIPASATKAEGISPRGVMGNLRKGKTVVLEGEGSLSLVCDFKVKTPSGKVRRITVQCASSSERQIGQAILLWNWEKQQWNEVGRKKVGSEQAWLQADLYEPGKTHIGPGGVVRAKVSWEAAPGTAAHVKVHHVSLLEVVDNL